MLYCTLLAVCTLFLTSCTLDFERISLDSNDQPVISDVEPAIADVQGGQSLRIQGKNLQKAFAVKIGEAECSNLVVVSDEELTCVSPSATSLSKSQVQVLRTTSSGLLQVSVGDVYLYYGIVLGQNSMEAVSKGITKAFNQPHGVAQVNGKLYFANRGNARINILNSAPTVSFPDFDGFLGQETNDLVESFLLRASRKKTTSSPMDIHFDGQHLVVADYGNNRVLIWNAPPASPFTPADVVLGQEDLLSNSANAGGVSARSLSGPTSARIRGGRLIVTDSQNHRVLIWNSIPTVNYAAADVVLGQADFTGSSANAGGVISDKAFSNPNMADVVAGDLVVADTSNNRVLFFTQVPTQDFAVARLVLGQSGFTTGSINQGGVGAATLYNPHGFDYDGTHFYVADFLNNRVLIWSGIPTINKAPADHALGQANFTARTAATSQTGMNGPRRLNVIGGVLYVTDYNNNRVLTFDANNLATNQQASLVIGQPDFTQNQHRNPNSDVTPVNPTSVATDGTRLAVVDYGKNRVLLWNQMPTQHNQLPDVVLGQADLTTSQGGGGANRMNRPFDAMIVGNRLFVSDTNNNRILIWNSWPTTNNQNADQVLGQADFATISANRGSTPSGISLKTPRGLFYDGQRMIVSDHGNHRVLIWNQMPADNSTAADVVVGQQDLLSNIQNWDGLSAKSLSSPQRAKIINGKLMIYDNANNRILSFDSVPSQNGASASVAIGQKDLQSAENWNDLLTDEKRIIHGMDFAQDGNNLLISTTTEKILKFAGVPSTSGAVPEVLLGHYGGAFYKPLGVRGFQSPFGMAVTSEHFIMADYGNSRVVILGR